MKSRANMRRHCECSGGSVSMKLRRASSTSAGTGSISAAPPASDENADVSLSTWTTSS